MYNVPMATFVSYSQCTSPQLLSKKHLKNSQAFKLVTLTKCWFNIWENICDLGTNIYSLGSKRYLHFAAMPAIMYLCCTIMHSWIRNRNTAALSSPRAGPQGLCAESARAVTGRRCPHSGEGEDFLMGQLNFFTKTAVTPERKVEKSIPRWEINRHAEG